MARHLWAFCVALATASQPQNATRQLDAYAPPATDLSRACASWRPDRSDVDRVRTIRAGNFVNLAHATGGAFVASVSKVRRPPKESWRLLCRGPKRLLLPRCCKKSRSGMATTTSIASRL